MPVDGPQRFAWYAAQPAQRGLGFSFSAGTAGPYLAMSLFRADVEKVALLARLELSAAELDALTPQLQQIVKYVESLGELDTADVAPMAHAGDVANVFADDVVRPSLPRDKALANAPHHSGECYLVPAVLGE